MNSQIFFNEENQLWGRRCPKCQNTLYHSFKHTCVRFCKESKLCKSCSQTLRRRKDFPVVPDNVRFDKEKNRWVVTCPKCRRDITQSNRNNAFLRSKFLCRRCSPTPPLNRKPLSKEFKTKLSEMAKKRWNDGKFREKMNSHLHNLRTMQINKRKVIVAFNPAVCNFLDKINENNRGMFFRHQKNHPDGEFSCLGYFADGYDEKNNIWFEYDEPHHETSYIKRKDQIRERRLIGKLKGRFIRYSEKYNTFYDVLANQTYRKVSSLL